MSTTSSDAPELPGRPGQLNGWKEIAAYLDRSVRTVQRWEKEFGLPVRRFGASRAESVFAFPREIDAWLLTAQGVSARTGTAAATPESPGYAGSRNGAASTGGGRAWWWMPLTLLLVGTIAVFSAWAGWVALKGRGFARQGSPPGGSAASGAVGAPATWRVDLDTLVVSDARGAALWTHRFPAELPHEHYAPAASDHDRLAGIVDLDGDGAREIWFIAVPPSGGDVRENKLYLFNTDGRVRWAYQFSDRASFGRITFGPPWITIMAFVTGDPGGGRGQALWVVSYDRGLFPSVLQRLDARTGAALSTYWSNGYIVSLALSRAGPRPVLYVGACNNERRAASLAVLDAMSPDGAAPAELDKYQCTSCPARDPLAFLVFPKPRRFGSLEQAGAVYKISEAADGGLTLGVKHAQSRAGVDAIAVVTLDASLRPSNADSGDNYLAVYHAMVAEGTVPAGATDRFDAEREFLPILRWDASARRYVRVSMTRAGR